MSHIFGTKVPFVGIEESPTIEHDLLMLDSVDRGGADRLYYIISLSLWLGEQLIPEVSFW